MGKVDPHYAYVTLTLNTSVGSRFQSWVVKPHVIAVNLAILNSQVLEFLRRRLFVVLDACKDNKM